MNKHLLFIKYILLISCFVFLFSGCSSKNKTVSSGEIHEDLLNRGLKQLENNDLQRALGTLTLVKDRYPYTESAIVASLRLADTYFALDKFSRAYDIYDEFDRYHPKNVNTPYVKYQKGMCYFKKIRSFDREQSNIQRAKIDFEKLIRLYPNDDYTKKARRHYRTCLLYLANFEIYVGDFYFKQKQYSSAIQRYTYAIKNFPDVGQYHEALEKISKCELLNTIRLK